MNFLPDLFKWLDFAVSIVILVLTLACKLKTNSRKWYKKLTFVAWTIICLTCMSFFFKIKIEQYQISEEEGIRNTAKGFIVEQQNRAIKQIAKSRDSIIIKLAEGYGITKNQLDISSKRSDSLFKRLITDSIKRITEYKSLSRPAIVFLDAKVFERKNDSLSINIQVLGQQSVAYNVKLYTQYYYSTWNGNSKVFLNNELNSGAELGPDVKRTAVIKVPKDALTVIVEIRGFYTDIPSKSDRYPFFKRFGLNVSTNKIMAFSSNHDKQLDEMFDYVPSPFLRNILK